MNKTILLISLQQDINVIGLKYLHYHLLANSYNSVLLFLPTYDDKPAYSKVNRRIFDFINHLSPLFFGISLMSGEYHKAIRLTNMLKSRYPSIPIIWGGIHPTIAPETCLNHADFVTVGEGENTLLDLANTLSEGKDPSHINNLCFRKNGCVVRNPLYPLIQELDELTPYDHVPKNSFILNDGKIVGLDVKIVKKYGRYTGIVYEAISSRGCAFSCTYCCNNALSSIYGSKKVRFRDLSHVIGEIKKAIIDNPYIQYINFQDDCFLNHSCAEINNFCDKYKKEIAKPFIIRSIPTFITRDKIARLKLAGLGWIILGLQSGSDRTCLEIYKRKSMKEDFLKAARIINEFRIGAFYDVILDNPFETDEDRLETVKVLMETPKPFYPQFFSLCFYPGTELRDRALQGRLKGGNEYQSKDYLLCEKTTLNNLARLATFLDPRYLEYLLKSFRNNPNSLAFKVNMFLARLLCVILIEPLTYLKIIWLSQNRSTWKTLRILPYFFKEGLSRFWKQFSPATSPLNPTEQITDL